MESITIRGLALHIDIDPEGTGSTKEKAMRAIRIINQVLEREMPHSRAYLFGEESVVVQTSENTPV
jgi:ribosomal protein L31E